MSQATAISWTDLTWNPVHGCSIVSTECRNCYAMNLSLRYGLTVKPWTPANAADNVILKPHKLREPLGIAKAWRGLGAAAAAAGKTDGKLVFVNSMSDLFHERVPDGFICDVFETMATASQHTFQILTKRPERMRDFMRRRHPQAEPLPNVWLGVSIGLRHFNHRADVLRDTPAAVRFISAEPLLGPLVYDTDEWRGYTEYQGDWVPVEHMRGTIDLAVDFLVPTWSDDGKDCEPLNLDGIDWLIVGGESGPDHRPMDVQWAADLRTACRRAGTAFFMKQDSGPRPGRQGRIPDDLWIHEFPWTQALMCARAVAGA